MKSKQKQPSTGVLRKRCSENLQQIYWRTPMPKCDFNKVASNFIEITLRHWYFPVHLLHIFRTPFPKNTSGWLLLSKLQFLLLPESVVQFFTLFYHLLTKTISVVLDKFPVNVLQHLLIYRIDNE